MNSRIRYIKHTTGLISKNVLKSVDGMEYLAVINEDGRSGAITLPDGTVVRTVSAASPHKTRIAIKLALGALGVNFEVEKRKPRK